MEDKVFKKNRDAMSDAIAESQKDGDCSFFSWFNDTASIEQSFIRGSWDFAFYFVNKEVCKYLKKPENKCCLEIGYGSGRLLNASRNLFKHSYGVDVHLFQEKVGKFLIDERKYNDFSLYCIDDKKFPFQNNSIDYVYSFIVIQHFYSKTIFEDYLKELQRVVAQKGLINLFFADLAYYPSKLSMKWLRAFFKGVLEEVNPPDKDTAHNTLWMSKRYVKKLMRDYGFEPVYQQRSYKKIPDGYRDKKGSQTGVLAIKFENQSLAC